MTTWEHFADALADALARLDDDAWVTLVVPPRDADPGTDPDDGAAAPDPSARREGIQMQLRRQETYLYAECTGGPPVGGHFPWTDAEQSELLALGWNLPPHPGAGVYVRHFPGDDGPPPSAYLEDTLGEEATTLAVRTIRDVYGLPTPVGMRLQGS